MLQSLNVNDAWQVVIQVLWDIEVTGMFFVAYWKKIGA